MQFQPLPLPPAYVLTLYQIGPKELFKHHEELKRLQSEHSLSHDSLKRKQKELEELERQNKLLERDVERYKNKQEYLRDIKQLTFKKCWVVRLLETSLFFF